MSTTFGQLIDKVMSNIQSGSAQLETATWINQAGGITANATSFIVNETNQMGRGLIEIGDELIYLDKVDNLTKTVTVTPWGRGFRGTTAATAANNAKVIVAPIYPRSLVKQTINDTIQASYPELFAVGTHTFSFNSAVTTYSLPAAMEYVLDVKWQTIGSTKEWLNVRRYNTDKVANTTSFPNGKTINIFDSIDPGRTVQVVFAKAPSTLTSDSDVYETVTGFPSSSVDAIMYGTIARLLMNSDAAKIPFQSVEADMLDQSKPVGSGASTARFYLGLYTQRLQQEAASLRDLYPPRLHYKR
jgi:hypothetical protein